MNTNAVVDAIASAKEDDLPTLRARIEKLRIELHALEFVERGLTMRFEVRRDEQRRCKRCGSVFIVNASDKRQLRKVFCGSKCKVFTHRQSTEANRRIG